MSRITRSTVVDKPDKELKIFNPAPDLSMTSNITLLDVQKYWEIPSIAYFCSLFKEAFNIMEFSIEELEEALINEENDTYTGSIPLVLQIVITLLQGCTNKKDINLSNYDQYLKEFLTNKYYEERKKPNSWNSLPEFNLLPLRSKILILNHLCDYRLESYDVAEITKNWESDNMRLEPLGKDQAGANYWYFYGTRLYQEILTQKEKISTKTIPTTSRKRKLKRTRKGRKNDGRKKSEINEKEEKECTSSNENSSEWKVICDTEEDWKNLTEKFAKSSNKDEKILHKRLVDNFLPEIGKLFIEKEKMLKKKLLEMAPKRVSHRIEKFKQQEHEKLTHKLIEDAKNQEALKARRIEEEIKRKEREIKDREQRALERMNMKEERARRANRRRENGYQEFDSSPEPCFDNSYERQAHKPSMTHGTRGSTSYFENGEAQKMYKVLQTIQKHKDAWPFRDPISERYAPGYFSIISNPMDLTTIGDKLRNRQYKNSKEFEQDFQLMFENCRIYNGPMSEYTRMAETVNRLFVSVMKNAFPLRSEEIEESKMIITYSKSKPQVKNEIKNPSTSYVVTTAGDGNVSTNPASRSNPSIKSTIFLNSNGLTAKSISFASGTNTTTNANSASVMARKDSILKMQLTQGFQKNFPNKVVSNNLPKLPTLLNKNGTNSTVQNQQPKPAASQTKVYLLQTNGNGNNNSVTSTYSSKQRTPSKITVIKLANNKKLVLAAADSTQMIHKVVQIPTQTLDVPNKRVCNSVANGNIVSKTKETLEENITLNEPQEKTMINNVGSSTIGTSPSHVSQTSTIIDPSHAGYCLQVPTASNFAQQQIMTVPSENQHYEINNGNSYESMMQPAYIQTQPMQYNYIDVGQIQQQQLVIPMNSQIVYTTPEVVSTNVGSVLQVYPNMVFQVASPVSQQPQVFPVQYFDGTITTGVL